MSRQLDIFKGKGWSRHRLPVDEEWRVAHYLSRAEQRSECFCIGDGSRYPTWGRPDKRRKRGSQSERIAQLVCRVTYGERPHNRSVVMHSCDNMACIRPDHLSWGTQSQNLADAVRKGRRTPPLVDMRKHVLSGKHHWVRLKPSDIVAIRARLAKGERQATIAADFGITFQQVSKIKLGQRWGWQ